MGNGKWETGDEKMGNGKWKMGDEKMGVTA